LGSNRVCSSQKNPQRVAKQRLQRRRRRRREEATAALLYEAEKVLWRASPKLPQ
jgi:hypothetical protein